MIKVYDKLFVLETNNTTYAFNIMETGQLEHIHYGRRIHVDDSTVYGLLHKSPFGPGNTIAYDQAHLGVALENTCQEISSLGKGDVGDPFVVIQNSDGSSTSDFLYDSYEIKNGSREGELPRAYGDAQVLSVSLKDKENDLILILDYSVYEECNVITRSARLVNEGKCSVSIKRLMSMQLDFSYGEFVFTQFTGGWAREMNRNDIAIKSGRYVNSTNTGFSSNRANPFVMLSKESTTETMGECYAFNLIYSGNHYEAVEKGSFGRVRFLSGISPEGFSYTLEAGQCFETPEAVMTYATGGYNDMSHNMHSFVRNHIVRGAWSKKQRPVLLNSWEAAYFDINETKLVNMAKAAKNVGIELFVMDDGWFGERNDDSCSLGDWTVNTKKLPGGLSGLCDRINRLGLMFGIWVEPEMVNVKSKLYETHPDWCICIPGKNHSEGRNQRLLDFSRMEVQDYIIESMSQVFSSANIEYVKWDMNRIFSDVYSSGTAADRQGEIGYCYMLGLYRVMKILTEKYPQILFEGCASGGNRFDLGILCYFPQIWGSDNTDAICRAVIQNGYTYGYPPEAIGAHVSGCPNHQTLRRTPLETRFAVASFGSLGYECNLADMSREDLAAIKVQIKLYKQLRDVMQYGDFYRTRSFDNGGNVTEWTVVSKDKAKAVGMILQKLNQPSTPDQYYMAAGLDENTLYQFSGRYLQYNVKEFGDLVNTVSPIHIKQDSLAHNVIAHFVKMPGEKEDVKMYGDAIMHSGVRLHQGFAGTGYSEEVRFFPDFAARLYFMTKDTTKEMKKEE